VRPERVVLKHHGRAAPLGRLPGHVVTSEADCAGIHGNEASDGPQQGGLAAARKTEDRRKASGLERERHVTQSFDLAVALADTLDRHRDHGR
jgi:hypothetical protein